MKHSKRNIPMIAITSLPLTAVSEGLQYVYQDWEFAKWIAIAVFDTGPSQILIYRNLHLPDDPE